MKFLQKIVYIVFFNLNTVFYIVAHNTFISGIPFSHTNPTTLNNIPLTIVTDSHKPTSLLPRKAQNYLYCLINKY